MIFNIITCVVCLAMLIIFRKFDRTNLKMAKLRRYSARLFDEFKTMAETENRRFNDATIEMDILIKKSDALTKNIAGSIKEIESRLHGLDIEKTNLKKVDEDIKIISQSARDVNAQIEFIMSAKESFSQFSHDAAYLKENIKALKTESADIVQSFGLRLKEKSKEITADFNDRISKSRELIENNEESILNSSRQKMQELTELYERLESDMSQRVADTSEILMQNFKLKVDGVAKSIEGASNLQNQIEFLKMNFAELESNIFSEMKERAAGVENDLNRSVDGLFEKLVSVEATVNESKSKLIKTFELEVDKVRNELDNLSIHAISKKDEIVHATRREAEEIRKKIDGFEERFIEFESRLLETAESKQEEIVKSAGSIEEKLLQFENKLHSTAEDKNEEISKNSVELEEKLLDYGNKLLNTLNSKKEEITRNSTEFEEKLQKLENRLMVTAEDKNEEISKNSMELEEKLLDYENKLLNTLNSKKEEITRNSTEFEEKLQKLENRLMVTAENKEEQLTRATADIEEKLQKFENKLVTTAENKKDEIIRSTGDIEEKLEKFEIQMESFVDDQRQAVSEDFSMAEKRLLDIKSEIIDYEEQSKIFARTDTLTNELAGSIDRLNRMLEDSHKEAQNLEKFFADIAYVKELARDFDREIRAYQNKKERLVDIESEIRSLQEMSDFALEKSNSCQEQFSKIDTVSSRIDALVESYGSLEMRIRELHEYEDVITKNLDSVNKTDILMQSMDGKINTFQKVVDRAEKRVDKLNQHLRDVEENTIILKTRESEIKEVKDKFGELEGLSEHMESRIKQIYAMFQKVETLRDEISITDTHLQELFTETDRKMKQFSDFIQAVDNNNPILKQVKGSAPAAKNMNENVVRTVRDLSNKGWTSDEISKKLMMDENAVRFIINTSSL